MRTELVADFNIVGIPRPKGSVKWSKGNYAMPASDGLKDWENNVRYGAIEYAKANNIKPESGVYSMCLEFRMKRPKKYKDTNLDYIPHVGTPDVDKAIRAVGDPLTGILYEDDKMVYKVVAEKRVCYPNEAPGVRIKLFRVFTGPSVVKAVS